MAQGREQGSGLRLEARQTALCCPCGSARIAARSLCARCYALRRQDRVYFGGLREHILVRDHYQCQACGRLGRAKRSLAVHHRRPGVSRARLLITLCFRCHARIHRTYVWKHPTEGLLHAVLWRELHPQGAEQLPLDFHPLPGPPLHQSLPLSELPLAPY